MRTVERRVDQSHLAASGAHQLYSAVSGARHTLLHQVLISYTLLRQVLISYTLLRQVLISFTSLIYIRCSSVTPRESETVCRVNRSHYGDLFAAVACLTLLTGSAVKIWFA